MFSSGVLFCSKWKISYALQAAISQEVRVPLSRLCYPVYLLRRPGVGMKLSGNPFYLTVYSVPYSTLLVKLYYPPNH